MGVLTFLTFTFLIWFPDLLGRKCDNQFFRQFMGVFTFITFTTHLHLTFNNQNAEMDGSAWALGKEAWRSLHSSMLLGFL